MLTDIQIDNLYIEIGKRIKHQRILAGYNQSKFALLFMISRASLVKIEKGQQRPKLRFIYDVARLCHIEAADLLPSREELNEVDWQELAKKMK